MECDGSGGGGRGSGDGGGGGVVWTGWTMMQATYSTAADAPLARCWALARWCGAQCPRMSG